MEERDIESEDESEDEDNEGELGGGYLEYWEKILQNMFGELVLVI